MKGRTTDGNPAPRTAAVIPILNEAATIQGVIENVRRHVEHVVVVDDGSTDESANLAHATGATVLLHDRNLGKGGRSRPRSAGRA